MGDYFQSRQYKRSQVRVLDRLKGSDPEWPPRDAKEMLDDLVDAHVRLSDLNARIRDLFEERDELTLLLEDRSRPVARELADAGVVAEHDRHALIPEKGTYGVTSLKIRPRWSTTASPPGDVAERLERVRRLAYPAAEPDALPAAVDPAAGALGEFPPPEPEIPPPAAHAATADVGACDAMAERAASSSALDDAA